VEEVSSVKVQAQTRECMLFAALKETLAVAREAATRAAALAVIELTMVAATAAAPADCHLQRYGAKRSDEISGT
jgi:hypothetical protein